MEEPSYLEYPISLLICEKCKGGEGCHTGYHMLVKWEPEPYKKVEVIKLQNEYDPDNCLYKVKAVVRWNCPSCGVPLQSISQVKYIPFEILKEAFGKCPSCGGNMDLRNEKINLESKEKMVDTIELVGEMVCDACKSKLPLSKKFSIKFKPIWNYINEIKKIKLSKEGLEFER